MRMQGAAAAAGVVMIALVAAGCSGASVEASDDGTSRPAATKAATERAIVPNVVGLSQSAATSKIEDAGFTVEVLGTGGEVASSTPSAGVSIDVGGEVIINMADPEPDGSRGLPYASDATVTATLQGGEEVALSIGVATWNADAAVMAENQFNDPAPVGSTYVLVPITVTNISSTDAVVPWLAWDIAYVAPDGRSFDPASAVIPQDIDDVGDLYAGGVGTGNLAFVLPVDAQGGVWAATYGWSDPVFIAAS